MVVVEPLVSDEKLRQLLDEQAESEHLDYKSRLDPRVQADLVELTKDIGAMQIAGGFIVIGADDRGCPTGLVAADAVPQFDEARLRNRLRKYLSEPFSLLTAHHDIDGSAVVIIYVGPNPAGLAVFSADGQYAVGPKSVTVFRRGDVWARHGSASERWNQSDVARVFARVIEARKEEWRSALTEDFRRLGVTAEARQLAVAPAGALTWNLSAEAFESTVIEQLRLNDDIPVRLLLERAPSDAALMMRNEQSQGDLGTLLDRLTCLAAVAIRVGRSDVRSAADSTLGEIYDLGFTVEADRAAWAIDAPVLWLEVLKRVMALGGLAVRRKDWVAVAELALRRGQTRDWTYYRSWVRHGLTMAARSRLFTEKRDGQQVELSLLSLSRSHADAHGCLRAGLPPSDERLLDGICQFDALAVLAAIADAGSVSTQHFYPNFARFFSHRTEPAIVQLLDDPALRHAVFPQPDQDLADALRELNTLSHREAFRYAGWDGYTDPRVLRFLEEHPRVGPGALG